MDKHDHSKAHDKLTAVANRYSKKGEEHVSPVPFEDKRPAAVAQRHLQEIIDNFSRAKQPKSFQETNAAADIIQRQILYDGKSIRDRDLIEEFRIRLSHELGYTPPCVNDFELNDENSKPEALATNLNSPEIDIVQEGGLYKPVISPATNDIGYNMHLPTAAPWIGANFAKEIYLPTYAGNMDKDNLKGTMTVQITGPAGDESLFQQVKKHELHHTEDNMEIGEKGLALWESVTPSSLPEKPQKLAKVQEDIAALKDLNPPKLEVAEDLINNWEKASADYHDSDKGKTKIDFERTAYNAEENKLTIVLDLTA